MLTLGTEAQKLASAVMLSADTNLLVSLHTRFAPHDPQALRLALTTVLRRKGRVLEAMTDTLAALRRRWPRRISNCWRSGPPPGAIWPPWCSRAWVPTPPTAYRTQLAQLETQAQQLEAQLSARSAAFRTQLQPVTLEQVQAALPTGSRPGGVRRLCAVHAAPALGRCTLRCLYPAPPGDSRLGRSRRGGPH